jgi:hypothetical protein
MNGQPNDHIVATSNMAIDQDDNGFLRRNRFDVSIVSNQAFDEYLASWASGYQDKAGCDLSSIFLPYTTHNPETRTNRFPIFEDLEPEYEAGIGVDRLLPWKYDSDATSFAIVEGEEDEDSIGDIVTGQIWPVKTRDVRHNENIRGMGLRGPIIVTGWGFGTNRFCAPSGTSFSGFKGPDEDDVGFGYQVDPSDYISAPLKLDYDYRRKVWVSLGWADEELRDAWFVTPSGQYPKHPSGLEYLWDRENPEEIEEGPWANTDSHGLSISVRAQANNNHIANAVMHFDSYGQLASIRKIPLWKLTDCIDEEVWFYTYTDLAAQAGRVVKINNACWSVSAAVDMWGEGETEQDLCTPPTTEEEYDARIRNLVKGHPCHVDVEKSFPECEDCLVYMVKLEKCSDDTQVKYSNIEGIVEKIGKAVTLKGDPDCWLVVEQINDAGDNETSEDEIVDEFEDCLACEVITITLEDCNDSEIIKVFNYEEFIQDNLDALGKVVKFEGNETCWSVPEGHDSESTPEFVELVPVVTEVLDDCTECQTPSVELVDCCDSENTLLVWWDRFSEFAGLVISLSGDNAGCWSVPTSPTNANDDGTNVVDVDESSIVNVHDDCSLCSSVYILSDDCDGVDPPTTAKVSGDLSASVGKIIKVSNAGLEDVCWTVVGVSDDPEDLCNEAIAPVSLVSVHDECDECYGAICDEECEASEIAKGVGISEDEGVALAQAIQEVEAAAEAHCGKRGVTWCRCPASFRVTEDDGTFTVKAFGCFTCCCDDGNQQLHMVANYHNSEGPIQLETVACTASPPEFPPECVQAGGCFDCYQITSPCYIDVDSIGISALEVGDSEECGTDTDDGDSVEINIQVGPYVSDITGIECDEEGHIEAVFDRKMTCITVAYELVKDVWTIVTPNICQSQCHSNCDANEECDPPE